MRDVLGGSVSSIWAITTYFDPFGTARRLANYRRFRAALRLPLLTVELTYHSTSVLRDGDADLLVRVRDGDVMWQKERLLNVALQALPPSCKFITWLDADVVFGAADWPSHLLPALETHSLVQPFSRVLLLPGGAEAAPAEPQIREAVVAAFSNGLSIGEWMGRFGRDHRSRKVGLGYAWAARREILARHGFFDTAVVGGGDRALLCAAYGAFDSLIEAHKLNRFQARHFLNWAVPFHNDVQGRVGFVHGDLCHQWHGELESRRYAERHFKLAALDFDPASDIRLGTDGAWRWNSEKPALHAFLYEYLLSRNVAEDE